MISTRKAILIGGVLAVFLFSVMMSARASADVGPLIENFENADDWAYTETDTYGTIQGGTTSDWKTEGENSYRLEKVTGDYGWGNDTCQIRKEIDFSDIAYFTFDAKLGGNYTDANNKAQVYVAGVLMWEKSFGTLTEYLNQSIDVIGYGGTENVFFRLWLGGGADPSENVAFYIDNLREVPTWLVELRWEETHGLVEDGSGGTENKLENGITVTFFFTDNSVDEFIMTRNPENFDVDPNIDKIRVDVTYDNYWRTRIIPAGEENATEIILVDNTESLDQYEFTLRDLTGIYGIEHSGQLWFSRYIDNQLQVHEDYWDAEDSVTAFLVYGGEYSLKLVTSTAERSYGRITADGILSKEISVARFVLPDPRYIWDYVAWSTWRDENDNLKVAYEDNLSQTENVTVRIYDENDNQVHTETFSTNQWTLTWNGTQENIRYVVELNINHRVHGNLISSLVASPAWIAPLVEGGGLPGIGQLGSLPFAWGSGVAFILVLAIALTFGARHAGLCVFAIGMILVMLGPIMGFFQTDSTVTGLIAFLMVIGVIMMLTKGGD